jgi:FkbM family methyltransferase
MARRTMRSLGEFMEHLASLDMTPRTVVDVGACWGTQELLQGAPEAHHVLIEPAPSMEGRLRQLTTKYRGEYHLVALGERRGRADLHLPKGGVDGATLLPSPGLERVEVPVETLDDLFGDRAFAAPLLLKTDCQGYDLAVIKGGRAFLKKVDVLVMEVNMFHPRGDRSFPDFGEIVCAMREAGFSVYDIVSYQVRPRDGALGYVDVAFAPTEGALRRSLLWS